MSENGPNRLRMIGRLSRRLAELETWGVLYAWPGYGVHSGIITMGDGYE
jgi:hypothetical protein